MDIIHGIILGLVQGLTEFLPISSSAHLILIRDILHIPLQNTLSFDVFLNTATVLAVIYCFWSSVHSIWHDFTTEGVSTRSRTLLVAIVAGSIPTGVVGFVYGDTIEALFRSANLVAWTLIGGSIIMMIADNIKNTQHGGITAIRGFIVGCFQTLALMSGFSRSGMSISGGLFAGLSREEAIRFSFLLLIPVSIGALLKTILDAGSSGITSFFDLTHLVAFISAFLSGVWAIRFLVRYLSRNSFKPFIIYRLIVSAAILLFV